MSATPKSHLLPLRRIGQGTASNLLKYKATIYLVILCQVKDTIAEVIQSSREIVEKRAGLLRVGLVAYRDVWDEKNNIEVYGLVFL